MKNYLKLKVIKSRRRKACSGGYSDIHLSHHTFQLSIWGQCTPEILHHGQLSLCYHDTRQSRNRKCLHHYLLLFLLSLFLASPNPLFHLQSIVGYLCSCTEAYKRIEEDNSGRQNYLTIMIYVLCKINELEKLCIRY